MIVGVRRVAAVGGGGRYAPEKTLVCSPSLIFPFTLPVLMFGQGHALIEQAARDNALWAAMALWTVTGQWKHCIQPCACSID